MQVDDHCPPQEWTAACLVPSLACACPTTNGSCQSGEEWCHVIETPLCQLHMQTGVSTKLIITEFPPPLFYVFLMGEVKQLRTALHTVSSQRGKLQGNYYYWKALVQNNVNKPFFHLSRENNFHLLHHYKALLLNLATKMISLPSHTNVLATGPGGRSGWRSF